MKNALLALAACLVVLVSMEAALRASGYDPLATWRNGREAILRPSDNPDLKYELTPGAAAFAWGTDIRVNSRGFRGPEPLASVPAGGRVIVLGDSITFGHYLAEESTFPRLLEQRLRAAGRPAEVLNFGVGGYDVIQEVSLLASRPGYHPTLVVLTYCLNDAGIASTSREYVKRLQEYRSNPLYHSVLAQFVSARIERFRNIDWSRVANRPDVFHHDFERQIDPIVDADTELLDLMKAAAPGEPFEWYRDRDRVGRVRFAFRQLAAMAREGRFRVVVMIVPWLAGDERAQPQSTVHRIVALEARRAGFDTLDPTAQFESIGMEKLRISPEDVIHPNAAGHAIMAGMLERYVASVPP